MGDQSRLETRTSGKQTSGMITFWAKNGLKRGQHPCRRFHLYASLPFLALIATMPVMAAAQETINIAAQSVTPSPDAFVELAADTLVYDESSKSVTAQGNVSIAHQGYSLMADHVIYYELVGEVHATGNVQITDPDGSMLLVDEARLDNELREGFIKNIRLILSDGSRLSASEGERSAGGRSRMEHVSFTPCPVCEDDVEKDPVWMIRAVRVIHDEEKKRFYYKDAVMEVLGVPILYLPAISHPDPRVKRASGFLIPEIGGRNDMGLSVALPYYHVFNDSMDATITPIINSKERPVLSGQFRRHLGVGELQLDGSATYTHQRDTNNAKLDTQEWRGHAFAKGNVEHQDNWLTNYQLQWASDDTYLRRYGFGDYDSLTSNIQTQAFWGQSWLSIRALSFQGLRTEDDQGRAAMALPMIQYEYVGKQGQNGGRWTGGASSVALVRTDGMDTLRTSGHMGWELPHITRWGQVVKLTGKLRGDVYHVNDAARADDPQYAGKDGTHSRFLPMVSASTSWPFASYQGQTTQIIEPIVDVVIAPQRTPRDVFPNEDSRNFELSDANILDENRFPGIDRWEGGARLNYGLRWQMETPGLLTDVFFAQSYRFNEEISLFGDGSGLEENFSDYVARVEVEAQKFGSIAYRVRLDKDTFKVRRQELSMRAGDERTNINIRYFRLLRGDEFFGADDRHEINAGGSIGLKANWSAFGHITSDLTDGYKAIAHSLGLLYRDDCLELSLAWQKSFTRDRDIVPGSSIMFRLRLKHLG